MSIDFRLKDFLYPTQIWRLHRTFDRNQWQSPEELQQYQLDRLKSTLLHAGRKVPYYRELFSSIGFHPQDLTAIEQISELPLLAKETLRDDFQRLMADDAEQYRPVLQSTSGTSGYPIHFYADKNSQTLEFVYYWRFWNWAGFKLGTPFAELTSHYFVLREEQFDAVSAYQPFYRRLLLNSNRIAAATAYSMAGDLRKYRVRYLKGVASALYFLALEFKNNGITDLELQAVFSSGELLTRMHRSLISSVFNAPVLDSYGHMERTVAVSQCPDGGYHVNSDYGLLEVVNQRTTPDCGNLIGTVVGTSLHNRAMPLIRYEVGDQIELQREPTTCSCGRTLPLIKALHGRTEESILTPDGNHVSALFIVPELVPGVRFLQFIQTAPDRLDIRLVPDSDWLPGSMAILQEYTSRMVGGRMKLEVHKVTENDLIRGASGKIRTVIAENFSRLDDP